MVTASTKPQDKCTKPWCYPETPHTGCSGLPSELRGKLSTCPEPWCPADEGGRSPQTPCSGSHPAAPALVSSGNRDLQSDGFITPYIWRTWDTLLPRKAAALEPGRPAGAQARPLLRGHWLASCAEVGCCHWSHLSWGHLIRGTATDQIRAAFRSPTPGASRSPGPPPLPEGGCHADVCAAGTFTPPRTQALTAD